ncbi:hypothetical protein M1555_03215 [Patescibacteria group bacterium]|nr:hypothetical protein [Patescibacteria group bacterium]
MKTGLLQSDRIISPVADIGELHTDVISPLSSEASESAGVAVRLGQGQTFGIYNREGTPAATFDNLGNASFSGTLTASRLVIARSEATKQSPEIATGSASPRDDVLLDVRGSATFSGTLYADRIVTRFGDITDLAASTVTAATVSATTIENITRIVFATPAATPQPSGLDATASAILALLSGDTVSSPPPELAAIAGTLTGQTLSVTQNLSVLGNTSLGMTSIAGGLTAAGPVRIGDSGLSTFGPTLFLEKDRLASVDILGGTLVVSPLGSVMVNGDLAVSGNLAVGGVLGVDTIAPAGGDLTLDLSSTELASGSASGSAGLLTHFGNLIIRGAQGQVVAAVTASGSAQFAGGLSAGGDVVASGAGIFRKLQIAEAAAASGSAVPADTTVGQATLSANTTDITITTSQVTDRSLIYITPITSTQNQVLYVAASTPGTGFTVGIDHPIHTPIAFNWWVVN